jgi:hypothetical protein
MYRIPASPQPALLSALEEKFYKTIQDVSAMYERGCASSYCLFPHNPLNHCVF